MTVIIGKGIRYRIIEQAAPLNLRPFYNHFTPANDTYWTPAMLAGYVVDTTLAVIRCRNPSLLEKRVIGVDPAEGLGVFRNCFPTDWVQVGFDIAPEIPRTFRADFTRVTISRQRSDSLIAISNLPFSIIPEMLAAFDRDRYDAFGIIVSKAAVSRYWQKKYVPPLYHLAHQQMLGYQYYFCPTLGWKKIGTAFQVWIRQEFERNQPTILTSSPYFEIGVSDADAAFGIACASSHVGKIRERHEFQRCERKYIKRIAPTLVSEQFLRHCVHETDWRSLDISQSTRVYVNDAIFYTVIQQTMIDLFAANVVGSCR